MPRTMFMKLQCSSLLLLPLVSLCWAGGGFNVRPKPGAWNPPTEKLSNPFQYQTDESNINIGGGTGAKLSNPLEYVEEDQSKIESSQNNNNNKYSIHSQDYFIQGIHDDEVVEGEATYSEVPAPYAEVPDPYAEVPAPYSEGPTAYSEFRAPYSEGPTPYLEVQAPVPEIVSPVIQEQQEEEPPRGFKFPAERALFQRARPNLHRSSRPRPRPQPPPPLWHFNEMAGNSNAPPARAVRFPSGDYLMPGSILQHQPETNHRKRPFLSENEKLPASGLRQNKKKRRRKKIDAVDRSRFEDRTQNMMKNDVQEALSEFKALMTQPVPDTESISSHDYLPFLEEVKSSDNEEESTTTVREVPDLVTPTVQMQREKEIIPGNKEEKPLFDPERILAEPSAETSIPPSVVSLIPPSINTDQPINNHRVSIYPTSSYLPAAGGWDASSASEEDLLVMSLLGDKSEVITENPLRYGIRFTTDKNMDHMRLSQEDTLDMFRMKELLPGEADVHDEVSDEPVGYEVSEAVMKSRAEAQITAPTVETGSGLDLQLSNQKTLKVKKKKQNNNKKGSYFPVEEILHKLLLKKNGRIETTTTTRPKLIEDKMEEGLQSLLVSSGALNYVQTRGGSESFMFGQGGEEYKKDEDQPRERSKEGVRVRKVESLKRVRALFDRHQDLESALVTNTLPRLSPHLDLAQMDAQPRMGAVGSGRRLPSAQLYIFHATLVELHKMIQETQARPGVPDDLLLLLSEAETHNMALLEFFFRQLVAAEGEQGGRMLSQKDRREFQKHFSFLRQIFPFL